MKILFTGASSFTGYWFVRELAWAGHEVVAIFRGGKGRYEGLRGQRVEGLAESCQQVFECSFGEDRFFDLINESGSWDVLCHHAADVTDYKSPDFNVARALANNTKNIDRVLKSIQSKGCSRVVLTGSVFENGEGAGSEGLPAFSPYGLSKAMTAEMFQYHTQVNEMRLGKFVIPNPFGPYEEPRFTSYLVRSWCEGKTPAVSTPYYVRDNIHVSLLAKAYVRFVEGLAGEPGFSRLNPCGYAGNQGGFAQLFAEEMKGRLGLPCELELKEQTLFNEPRVRLNTDVLDYAELGWDEAGAWDELAQYYRQVFGERVGGVSAGGVRGA